MTFVQSKCIRIENIIAFHKDPYRCAPGTGICRVEDRIDHARNNAEEGLVDPVENLNGKPLYIFAGGNDGSAQASAPIIKEFFETLGGIVDDNVTNPCGHGVVS